MHGEIAQTLTIIAHGSPWLGGDRARPVQPELRMSAFWRVARVEFVLDAPSTSTVVAESVDLWLRWLADRGTDRLWLFSDAQDRQPWGILTRLDDATALWSRTDSGAIDPDADEPLGWLRYTGVRTTTHEIDAPALPLARSRLRDAIENALAFATEHQLDWWAERFAEAVALASNADPRSPDYPDMLPDDAYGEQARSLLATAVHAWVFGGMGSWNDLPDAAADDPPYKPLSEQLYACIWDGFLASINSPIKP